MAKPSRHNLRQMLDVAHDTKVAGYILRGAMGGQEGDAPLGSYVIVSVQHIEVCLKALSFASTGQVLPEHDVLALYDSLSVGELAVLEQEFEWVRERTGSKLDLATTVKMARDAAASIHDTCEIPRTEGSLDIARCCLIVVAWTTRKSLIPAGTRMSSTS